jgi:hypothetical protein
MGFAEFFLFLSDRDGLGEKDLGAGEIERAQIHLCR